MHHAPFVKRKGQKVFIHRWNSEQWHLKVQFVYSLHSVMCVHNDNFHVLGEFLKLRAARTTGKAFSGAEGTGQAWLKIR